jgi:hypothetical protein
MLLVIRHDCPSVLLLRVASVALMSTVIAGITGDARLNYIPKPDSTMDLAGIWTTCKDDLFHDTGSVTWPGTSGTYP